MPMPDYMSNPLFHMGLGLMSVPNQSYLPGAVSWGPGIQRGLLGYQQSLLYQNQAEEQAQRQEMQKRRLEWEMQRQQQAQEAAAQQAQAYEQYLAGQSPEMQTFGRAFGPGAMAKIAAQQFESPEIEGEAGYKAWLQANGLQPTPGSYEQYLRLRASIDPKAKAAQITNILGSGFKPETQPGKRAVDIANLTKLRNEAAAKGEPTAVYDSALAKLQQEQSNLPQIGAEEQRMITKMQTVGKLSGKAEEIAAKNPGVIGPFDARWEALKATVGRADTAYSELMPLESMMKTQLATALSGAAIPETEWPKYEAQVPLATDTPEQRRGKVKAYEFLMRELGNMARVRRGEAPLPPPESTDDSALTPEEQALVDKYGG